MSTKPVGSPKHWPQHVASSYGCGLEDVVEATQAERSATDLTDPQGVIRAAPRRVIVMRHGERVDDLFPGWIEKSCMSGTYKAYDLNMPLALPEIDRPMAHYGTDTVLTEMGSVLAQMVGRGLLVNKTLPDAIYTSPALRCIQTASQALKATGHEDQVKIRIEPALFENINLYPGGQPKFASAAQLKAAEFNIDYDYVPIMSLDKLWSRTESIEEYGERLQDTLLHLADKVQPTRSPFGPILMVVGHASTCDLAMGAFRDPIRRATPSELLNIGLFYPFCATAVFDRTTHTQWKYGENALPPISYRNFTSKVNPRFANRTRIE